ncbi:hypothetical protein VVT58_00310 [Sphingobium sp. SJ10-10]|nr:hypothetical protein [Sphingobium sp. SJ10-10]
MAGFGGLAQISPIEMADQPLDWGIAAGPPEGIERRMAGAAGRVIR